MSRDIIIPHEEIQDTQKITEVNIRKFKENGLDIHLHEVEDLEDDFKKKVRRLRVKNTRYFIM